MNNSLSDLLLAHHKSHRKAIVCPESVTALSYVELHRLSGKVSRIIKDMTLDLRSPVALLFQPSVEFSVAFFAVLYSGGIAAPIDRFIKKGQLDTLIAYMRPALIITTESLYRRLPQSNLDHIPVLTIDSSPWVAQKEMCIGRFGKRKRDEIVLNHSDTDPEYLSEFHLDTHLSPERDAVFITTSGTTGVPKIVRLSHEAVLSNIRGHFESLDLPQGINGIQTLEISYSYGLIASFLTILYAGGTVFVAPRLDIAFICRQIKENQIELWVGTPFLFRFVTEKADNAQLNDLRCLKKVVIGGDHCSPALRRILQERLAGVSINITYGLTEAGPRVSTLPAESILHKDLSVGLPINGVQVRIMDVCQDRECAIGEVGQMVIQTPSMMSGYYRNLNLSRKTIRNNQLYTGDLGKVDPDGFLYLKGRIDDQFKFRGRMVNPREIEHCITSLTGVFHAHVFKAGIDGDATIEAEISYNKTFLDTETVRRHCMKHLPMHMVPGRFKVIPPSEYHFKGKKVSIPFAENHQICADMETNQTIGG